MLQEEFYAYTQLNPSTVNIWYTGSAPSVINGLSVPVLSASVDLTPQLTQVQQITVPLPTVGTSAILNITSRTATQSGTTKYFFFLTDPYNTTQIISPSGSGDLIFSPSIDAAEFNASPYNVLGGLVETQRQSTYIMDADEYKVGGEGLPVGYVGPINIYSLLSGSADRARVQDSNYTISGWSNARYKGSVTDIFDYSSTPAAAGSIFQGSVFPLSAADTYIKSLQSGSAIVYRDLFYIGVGDTPGFAEQPTNFLTSGSTAIQPSGSIVFVNSSGFITFTNPFKVGDYIKVSNQEVMKITAIGAPIGSVATLTLQVIRNIRGGFVNVQNPGMSVELLNSSQIYEVENNRLNGVVQGKVLVQGSGEILVLDSNGYVIEVS